MLRTAWSKRSQPLPCAPFSTPTGVDHDLAFRLRILWRQPRRFPVYQEAAVALGRHLAERGLTLVYGGGAVGLMGTVADAVLPPAAK